MHTAARTTSVLASAGLLGALAFAALTMNFAFTPREIVDMTHPITMSPFERPAPTPPVTHPQPRPHVPDAEPIDTNLATEPAETVAINPVDASWVGPPAIPTIVDPHWLQRPTNLQIYYPRRALERHVEGSALLDCLVTTRGNLECSVVSETPPGWDFAAAALRISRAYQMVPAMRDGAPIQGRYRMRVPFRLT